MYLGCVSMNNMHSLQEVSEARGPRKGSREIRNGNLKAPHRSRAPRVVWALERSGGFNIAHMRIRGTSTEIGMVPPRMHVLSILVVCAG